MADTERRMERGREKGGWWDEECRRMKREVRRALRIWRQGRGEESEFRNKKKEYRKMCEEKKKERNERWKRKITRVMKESEVWEIINRERGRRKRVSDEIEMNEWREHFMRLLGGVDNKVRMGEEGRRRGVGEETEIEREELRRVLKSLKEEKAVGGDSIVNEVWKYGGEGLEECVWKFCNRVWKGDGWPEKWKDGIVVPIVKKGEGRIVEEYRGITLMDSIYKVYTGVLAGRLKEEVEAKSCLSRCQTGFRKGMGTIKCAELLGE